MRLLLDTHLFIWSVTGNRKLKSGLRTYLASAEAVYVSAASIWEIAIKVRLGKIDGDLEELAAAIESSGFLELADRCSARRANRLGFRKDCSQPLASHEAPERYRNTRL